jgi:polyisoprenoid-binding protein YceI
MSSLDVVPLNGTFAVAAPGSTFAFGIRHSGVFWYRGVIPEVTGALRVEDDGAVALEGAARVESISVREPEAMRASVLGAAFFDAERFPELTFRSTSVQLLDDGVAEVDGELTMRGATVPVAATGTWAGSAATSIGELAGLSLHATIDRRAFGLQWQNPLPDGTDQVGWEVAIDVDLMLLRAPTSG